MSAIEKSPYVPIVLSTDLSMTARCAQNKPVENFDKWQYNIQ